MSQTALLLLLLLLMTFVVVKEGNCTTRTSVLKLRNDLGSKASNSGHFRNNYNNISSVGGKSVPQAAQRSTVSTKNNKRAQHSLIPQHS